MVPTAEIPVQVKPQEPQKPKQVAQEPVPANINAFNSNPSSSAPMEPSVETLVEQVTLDANPVNDIQQPTTAEPIATSANIPTDGYFAEISSIVGTINPDATIQEVLVQINKKLAEQKKPVWQVNDTSTAKIAFALEKARTAKVADKDKQTDLPKVENAVETEARLNTILVESRTLVNSCFDTERKIVEEYLLESTGQPPDNTAINAEIARRTQLQDDQPDLKKALEIRKKIIAIEDQAEADYKTLTDQLDLIGEPHPDKVKFQAQYYDKKAGLYWEVNGGKRVGLPIDYNLTVGPYIKALLMVSEEKTGTPPDFSPNAKKAQVLIRNLDLDHRLIINADGTAILDKSPEPTEKAHREIFETAYQTIAHYLGKDIADAVVAGSTDKYDLKLVLDRIKRNPNMALADLATTVYLYNHGEAKDNPFMQGNIDASLYYQLQGLTDGLNAEKPELAEKIRNLDSHDGLMKKRFNVVRDRVKDFLGEHNINVSDKNIMRILTLSTFFEGQTEITQAHGLQLKEEAKQIVIRLQREGLLLEDDVQAIKHLAHNSTGSGLFQTLYGADVKALMKGKTVGDCANFVVGELINQNNPDFQITEAQRAIASQILETQMTETGLKRLNTLGLPPGMSMILMLAFVMLPNFQGAADEAGTEKGGGGGGGGG